MGFDQLAHAIRHIAVNAYDAADIADEIGYPVALKIVSPDILHKTEFGGVRVNITDDAKMKTEFTGLLETVKSKKPGADIWGVLVQQMAPKGTETILGMNRDPSFGPILMFGLGGIYTEALRDVSFRLAPLRPNVADEIVNKKFDLVINTPLGRDSFFDDRAVRRAAMMHEVPCITTLTGAAAAVSAIRALREHGIDVRPLQDYYAGIAAGRVGPGVVSPAK